MTVTPDQRRIVSGALRDLHMIALSAERHESCDFLFVDHDQTRLLSSPDWQVVFGRPGTGKSMLLRVWQERLTRAVEESRLLPVYISARDLLGSFQEEEDPGQRAVAYLQVFLERLAQELLSSSRHLRARKRRFESLRAPLPFTRSRDEHVRGLVRQLHDVVGSGRPLRSYSDLIQEDEQMRTQEQRRTAGAGLGGFLGRRGADVSVRADAARSSGEAWTGRRRASASGRPVPRYGEVRDHIVELCGVLDLDGICILLDEWSVLQPVSVQPKLGELLARALGGTPAITMKIAANRSQTHFFDEEAQHGFRPNRDIIEAVDLGHALMDEIALVRFFEEVLFKRLLVISPEKMEVFLEDRSGQPSEDFISAMFANRGAFEALVKGTEGVPRDFFLALAALVRRGVDLEQRRWTADDVRQIAGSEPEELAVEAGMPEAVEEPGEAEGFLERVIKPTIVQTKSRLFLVTKDREHRAARSLDELLELGVIEPVGAGVLPADLRETYTPYRISRDTWGAFERAIRFKEEETVMSDARDVVEPRMPRIADEEGALPFLLDL